MVRAEEAFDRLTKIYNTKHGLWMFSAAIGATVAIGSGLAGKYEVAATAGALAIAAGQRTYKAGKELGKWNYEYWRIRENRQKGVVYETKMTEPK
jgi:hypothetical protein